MVENSKRILKEAGKKLVEIEVCFFEEKTLKGDNIRLKDSELVFLLSLFYYLSFSYFFTSILSISFF